MILSVVNDKAIIRATNGDKFYVNLGVRTVDVPARDGTGGTKKGLFDFSSLVLKGVVAPRTTADEASAAMKIIGGWFYCPEQTQAIKIIKRFLDSKRDERRDATILKMAELYGSERALKLSNAIREKGFSFPAWFIKETGFAKIVVGLIDDYRGVAGGIYYPPKDCGAAVRVCYGFGGSKCSCWIRKTIQETGIADDRIPAIFEVAKYLETNR